MHDYSFLLRDFNMVVDPDCAGHVKSLVIRKPGTMNTIVFVDKRASIQEVNVTKTENNKFVFALFKKPQQGFKEFGDDVNPEKETKPEYDLGIDPSFNNSNGGTLEFYGFESEASKNETTIEEYPFTVDELKELFGHAQLNAIMINKNNSDTTMFGPFDFDDAVEFIKFIECINLVRGLQCQANKILAPLIQNNKNNPAPD